MGFGDLTPLLAPRSVAVIGASDREGNLGGTAVRFLRKFAFAGPVWPVNATRDEVGGLRCYPTLAALPDVPDLAVIAVAADKVCDVVRDCIAAGVPAAVVWAGGFAEGDAAGQARQRELEDVCRGTDLRLCGPNCLGVINTALGMTANFSSLMSEIDAFNPGSVSMVSQSGGIGATAHGRAQELGLGFRVNISCGNEAVLGVHDFIQALARDDGTRVIAVYVEGLVNAAGFVEALRAARDAGKPVVMLKGGATEASSRAALAHTGKLAGLDRTFDAIFTEFGVVRVFSMEELLDVALTFAQLRPGQMALGNRVLLSSFGGGSGVVGTDQCVHEGLEVPPLDPATREALKPVLSPLASALNPIDLTPGHMTTPAHRANLPKVLELLAAAPGQDIFLFFSAGFGKLALPLAEMAQAVREGTDKPVVMSWLSPPPGILDFFARRGLRLFDEHARAIRAAGHLARHAANTRHRIRRSDAVVPAFDWDAFVPPGTTVVSEDLASRILEAAGLPVARGMLANSAEDAVRLAHEVGYPVAMKGISPAITHRAAAGLVALDLHDAEAVTRTAHAFEARAAARDVTLDGIWVQHMARGAVELLVTAFRDRDFGVMVGVGMGGGMTEIIDDVTFARAPLDAEAAFDLIGRLRSVTRHPHLISASVRHNAAGFVARFSALVASAPWPSFTFEVNPLKLGDDSLAAVDGLLLIE